MHEAVVGPGTITNEHARIHVARTTRFEPHGDVVVMAGPLKCIRRVLRLEGSVTGDKKSCGQLELTIASGAMRRAQQRSVRQLNDKV